MAKQKDLLIILQNALPRLASDMDHRMRALREGDKPLLPSGGRGPHAPDLTPLDAAYMIIAAASLERPRDGQVLRETKKIGQMRAREVGFMKCKSFVEALKVCVSSRELARQIACVRIDPITRHASFEMMTYNEMEWGAIDHPDDRDWFNYSGSGVGSSPLSIGVTFALHSALLEEISGLFQSQEEREAVL